MNFGPDGITPKFNPTLVKNYHLADYQHKLIMESIQDFEKSLDDNHEIALKLTHVGQAITLLVEDIGYLNPSLLQFQGTVNGKSAVLMQHVSQINFLMIAVPKLEPSKPPCRIGFKSNND